MRAIRGLGCLAFFAWSWSGGSASPLRAETKAPALLPPSSIAPPARKVSVRITHRHRAVRECTTSPSPVACVARELDADSATSLRLTRSRLATATLESTSQNLQVTFPHHVGLQEQTIELAPGDWLVDWPGAAAIGRLHIAAGATPEVSLATTSGRCRLKEARCELESKRTQQLTIRNGG